MKQIGEIAQIKGLTKTENEIVNAASGAKIRDVIVDGGISHAAQTQLTETLAMANINLGGQKLTKIENFNVLLVSIVELLAERHKSLSLDEVCRAILYGSLGEWKKDGETLYLSATNVNLWIKSYLNEKKLPAFMKKAQLAIPETAELTEAEKHAILLNGLKEKFERFKSGEFSDPGNSSYDFLDSLGKIPFTAERKKEFMAQAKAEILKSKKAEKEKAFDSLGITEVSRYLEALQSGEKGQDIVIVAKKIALKTLFSDMVDMGEDWDV